MPHERYGYFSEQTDGQLDENECEPSVFILTNVNSIFLLFTYLVKLVYNRSVVREESHETFDDCLLSFMDVVRLFNR